jgi:hypothetical protein
MRTCVNPEGPFDHSIYSPDDWPSDFCAIVDPMILRSADILLCGPPKEGQEDIWETIDLTALMAFFDLLVFEDKIPMIDYGATFSPAEGFKISALYDIVNSLQDSLGYPEKPLVTVHVGDTASQSAREKALIRLADHGEVGSNLSSSIYDELTALEHNWRPDLTVINPDYTAGECDTHKRIVTTFIYGGMLFGELAGQAGVPHCLHAKRSRLDLGVASNARSADYENEKELNLYLDKVYKAGLGQQGIPNKQAVAIPSVLPYLLHHEGHRQNIEALVLGALDMRHRDEVKRFRDWKRELVEGLRENPMPPEKVQKEMNEVAIGVANRFTPAAGKGINTIFKFLPIPEVWADRLWCWALRDIPHRHHLKLLFELQVADRAAQFSDRLSMLDKQLKPLWKKWPERA